MSKYIALMAAAAVVTACSPRGLHTRVAAGDVAPVVAEVTTGGMLPAGSDLAIRLGQPNNLRHVRAGERFTAIVPGGVVARNGEVIVPAGSRVAGRIVSVHDAHGQALIQLKPEFLEVTGRDFLMDASVIDVANVLALNTATGQFEQTGAARVLTTADVTALGHAVHIDATAGTVISAGASGRELVIPAGTMVMLRMNQPISFQYSPTR